MKNKTVQILVTLTALWLPGLAQAATRGVIIGPGELSRPARARLTRQLRGALRASPRLFTAVARLRATLPALERRQRARGRLVAVVRPLRALGRRGLMPMLRELAVDARPRGPLSELAWRGWRVSLLEAVGSLRDARAEPVLRAILAAKEPDSIVLRAAAVALGRRGTAGVARTLIRLSNAPDSDPAVLIPALGQCRRAVVARALASMLGQAGKRPSRDALVAAALGQVGNAWAWQTPAVARSGEGEATRKLAMTALVGHYPALLPRTRETAIKSLLMVAHPGTRAAVAAAKKKARGGDHAEALAGLQARLAASTLPR